LDPHSPGAHQIDTLQWIGFLAGAIVVVAINAALIVAVRRGRARRGAEPRPASGGRRAQMRVGAALAAFAVALLVLGIVFTDRAQRSPASGPAGLASAGLEPLTIKATGQQWLWRYSYPNGAFSYYKLVVPVDTAVKIDLVSTDVVHTWNVPDLAGKHDAVPGKVNEVVFRAEEEGAYGGSAATLSGEGYGQMRTEVDVVSPAAYKAFVARQKADVQAAQDRVVGLIENGEAP
jgi:cytochrome c oxidase subunit II